MVIVALKSNYAICVNQLPQRAPSHAGSTKLRRQGEELMIVRVITSLCSLSERGYNDHVTVMTYNPPSAKMREKLVDDMQKNLYHN